MKKRRLKDMTAAVMQRIAKYEQERSGWWLRAFHTTVVLLGLVAGIFAVRLALQVRERQTLDMVTLFREDTEIIREFWQDTVEIIVIEFPFETIATLVGILVVLVFLLWTTRRKRIIAKRRLSELAKRAKK
jgi:hypothetical protein